MSAVLKPQTIIRNLQAQDCSEAMQMSHELHEMSSMAFLPFKEEKIRQLFAYSMAVPDKYLCLLAEHEGELIGIFFGCIVPYYFNDELMAQEYCVYVRKPYQGTHAGTSFVKRFYDWAKINGAREVQIAPSVGIQTKRTEKWLNNIGYETSGVMTKRRIE